MRVIALLASYNERRFIRPCLEHLHDHDVEAYLIDNCSDDETVTIAERHLGRGLIGIEQFPRDGGYNWVGLLRRKEELAGELEADWFIHLDPDELRLPPPGEGTLADALAMVDREGFNAVNFFEFTFMPTREEPHHDHPDFERTLRTYYPFAPTFPDRPDAWKSHQLKAWKSMPDVELAPSGGHRVSFPGLHAYPQSFPMKHYLFLSIPHAVEKYVQREYDPDEIEAGRHGWRAHLTPSDIRLPSESELRVTQSDNDLDPRKPRTQHYIDDGQSRRPT